VIKIHDLGPPVTRSMKLYDEWFDEWFEAHGEGINRQIDPLMRRDLFLVSEEGFYQWSTNPYGVVRFRDKETSFAAAVANQGNPHLYVVETIKIVKRKKWVTQETEVVGEAFSR